MVVAPGDEGVKQEEGCDGCFIFAVRGHGCWQVLPSTPVHGEEM